VTNKFALISIKNAIVANAFAGYLLVTNMFVRLMMPLQFRARTTGAHAPRDVGHLAWPPLDP
jgi:hypothetical protein